jgi:hypothetical protein
MHIDADEHV